VVLFPGASESGVGESEQEDKDLVMAELDEQDEKLLLKFTTLEKYIVPDCKMFPVVYELSVEGKPSFTTQSSPTTLQLLLTVDKVGPMYIPWLFPPAPGVHVTLALVGEVRVTVKFVGVVVEQAGQATQFPV
jgi:hypothetical protein